MGLDVESLEPKIRSILTAPGTDLATISAKRVRKQLLELDSSLSVDVLKENREEIDVLISRVFEEVSGAQQDSDEEDATRDRGEEKKSSKRKKGKEEDIADHVEGGAPPSKKIRNGQELSDEKLARKLSSEINGRSLRAGKGRSTGGGKKGGRSKKSTTTVDSDDNDEVDGGKKKKRGGGKGGFGKEYSLSEPLSAVLQVDKLSRPQVVKQLWVYIKENGLQNPSNKREIVCDSGLKAIFGVDKIDMFKMNQVLGQHLHEAES